MTTVLDGLTRAMRMNGTLADGEAPSASEATDGLATYNQMQRAMFGDIIGVKLEPVEASTTTGMHGAIYEGGAAAYSITFPANPKDGWRIGASDARGAFATFNLTLIPNGRKIAGSTANVVLSTNSTYRTYFHRADTGDWVLEADQLLTDTIYFPDDMIGGLIAMLALALTAEYGTEPKPIVAALSKQGADRFRQRYGRRGAPRAGSPAAAIGG